MCKNESKWTPCCKMERFAPAKLIKACRKIIVFINLKIYEDLMMFLLQVIKLNIIKT